MTAFAQAVHLLSAVEPFASCRFGSYAKVLMGQIKRRHYIFVIEDGFAIGYAGWALCAEPVARAWAEGHVVPAYEDCIDGDSWVGITFHARDRATCWTLARWLRRRYPEFKGFGIRAYGQRRRRVQLVNVAPRARTPGHGLAGPAARGGARSLAAPPGEQHPSP